MSDRIRTTDDEVDRFVETVEAANKNPLAKIVELLMQRNPSTSDVLTSCSRLLSAGGGSTA